MSAQKITNELHEAIENIKEMKDFEKMIEELINSSFSDGLNAMPSKTTEELKIGVINYMYVNLFPGYMAGKEISKKLK